PKNGNQTSRAQAAHGVTVGGKNGTEISAQSKFDNENKTVRQPRGVLSKEAIPTAVNEWLVNTGDKLILVDTGTSNLFGRGLGGMVKTPPAAGVAPAAGDMVILTHLPPDHAGGLLTADKKIAFANATVHVSEAEYAFWTSAEISAKAADDFKPFFEMARNSIKPYVDAGKVERFKDGAAFAPGIVASAAPGHTVGHTMVRLSSGPAELLLWGDIVHNAA